MSQDKIIELSNKIKTARDAYYNMQPTMEDSVYDALIDELKSIDPNNEQVKAIGSPTPSYSVWEKVKHEIPMGSLDKVNSEEEFDDWILKNSLQGVGLNVSYKVDGSSMELVYEHGNLVRAVTRGDGNIGEDVTSNIVNVKNFPKKLHDSISITVRGEVVMLKDVFNTYYSEQYANPRNTAAGKVRDKKNNGKDCENLVFLAYRLHGDIKSKTMNDMFTDLESFNFQVPRIHDLKSDFKSMKELMKHITDTRNDIPYEIDGVVISVDNVQHLEDMGELNMRPKGQIAWKFKPSVGITKAVDIKWQVGNTGRLCPVLKCEPVNVGGVIITSVSLHNLSLFKDLAIKNGDRVIVSRRNDVIPYLQENLDRDSK